MFDSQPLSIATLRLYLRSGIRRDSAAFHATVWPTDSANGLPLIELPIRSPRQEAFPSTPTRLSHIPRWVPSTVGATLVLGWVTICIPWREKVSAAEASSTFPLPRRRFSVSCSQVASAMAVGLPASSRMPIAWIWVW